MTARELATAIVARLPQHSFREVMRMMGADAT
jgi:hypothetical protein